MKILNTKVLNGPNYWSNNRKKLIELKLDLEEFEFFPTSQLNGFTKRLKSLLPTLYNHRCSLGINGGFFQRLEEGTWLGHVIEHVALELQTLAGMDCGFGRTYSAHEEGVYHVIFSYEIDSAGLYAAKTAVNLVETLALEKDYQCLEHDLNELKRLFDSEKLGPSTGSIVNEAKTRKIPVISTKGSSLIILGQGIKQKKMWATVTSQTSTIGVDIAADKEMTKQILAANYISVPEGLILQSLDELEEAVAQINFPLVIKPQTGNHGRGITTNINSLEKALKAFSIAKKVSDKVIVERYIKGEDYRFLVVNHQVVAVAKRTPAMIIGTGFNTIQELIDITNQDPKRGHDHENLLTTIKVDVETQTILKDKKLSLNFILPEGEVLYLKGTGNLSAGGTAADVTDDVHPFNIHMAEKISTLIDLDICGVDIVCETVTKPIIRDNGAIVEVNAGPGFRMHLAPNEGQARNVAVPVLDMLYPVGSTSRIPVIAVTGTNGKTTVVRLIAHLAKQACYSVGFTTTEGIYINNELIYSGDCSGPASASTVLQDPMVDFAVLECARGGILRSGLGFDQCDISIITNITSDHLGLNDIHTLEQLAKVKAVVANSTAIEGYSILNADDDLVYAIKKDLSCNVALFGKQDNERIREHCDAGGLAAYIEHDFIVVRRGHDKSNLAKIADIPITFYGTAICMIQNVLPAVLAGVISNFGFINIMKALYCFDPTVENMPGRMNVFNFNRFKVMMDYAHNEAAFIELKHYLNKIICKKKVGIIGATGDRRAEDIQKIGYYSAQIFDDIIIRHDKNGRGRTNQELTNLLLQGIKNSGLQPKVTIISEEFEAIKYAMEHAIDDTFIFYTVDDVFTAIDYMKKEERKFHDLPNNKAENLCIQKESY